MAQAQFKIGQQVEADVTGTGEFVQGKVIEVSARKVKFDLGDGSEPVNMFKRDVSPLKSKPKAAAKTKATKSNKKEDNVEAVSLAEAIEEDVEGTGTIIRPDTTNWFKGKDPETGRRLVDSDDDVASMLRGLTVPEVFAKLAEVAKAHGVETIGRGKNQNPATVKGMTERWGHLNVGQQRMNAGNVLRGILKKAAAEDEDES